MIDVHAHFDDERYDEDRDRVLAALPAAGITRLINSGSTFASCKRALELTRRYDYIYASIGIYPHDTPELEVNGLEALRQLAQQPKVVAIGEIGLDYYYDGAPKELQQKWFHKQLELAEELNLPVVIHSRDAMRDTLEILRQHPNNRGIFHCYSGSVESLREVVALGWSISMGGVVTFKNSRVTKEVAAAVPADRLMLETDSPYLAPVPYRGKRNTSAYLTEVVAEIARLRETTPAEILRMTDENAQKMFNFS